MIKLKEIQPLFTSILTTANTYEEDSVDSGGLVDSTKQAGALKEYQTVIAIGGAVRDINVGDLVCINPSRYAVTQHQAGSLKDGIVTDNPVISYNFKIIEVKDSPCLFLQDRDIDFIIKDSE